MTHTDAGHYAAKHPDSEINPAIADAIDERADEGRITCADAHAIAAQQGCPPKTVGINIDLLEKRIAKCQMGLFGHGSKKGKAVNGSTAVTAELEEAIREAVVDGRITCEAAWDLAKRLGMTKMDVANACETLSVKVSKCQLGAF